MQFKEKECQFSYVNYYLAVPSFYVWSNNWIYTKIEWSWDVMQVSEKEYQFNYVNY